MTVIQLSENCVQKLLGNLNSRTEVKKKLEANRIVERCMQARYSYICRIKSHIDALNKKAQLYLSRYLNCNSSYVQDKLLAVCGKSEHTSKSEAFFRDTCYEFPPKFFNTSIVISESGKLEDILPVTRTTCKGNAWTCDDNICKVKDINLIDAYVKYLKEASSCNVETLHKFIDKTSECHNTRNPYKLGHPRTCYEDYTSCKSIFIPVLILMPHFPAVRYFCQIVYKLTNVFKKIICLDEALENGDRGYLELISEDAQHTVKLFENKSEQLGEEELRKLYQSAFVAFEKKSMDTPKYVCVSCQKLCFRRHVTVVKNFRAEVSSKHWLELMKFVKKYSIKCDFICHYCLKKFRDDEIPPTCILNSMFDKSVPVCIQNLNDYERILIQRAKAFQVVKRMKTVSKKSNVPNNRLVNKVVGRTFHLPLPIEESLKKICPENEPINFNHELYVFIRSIPNKKSKIIWEELVDMKKVFQALVWLKKHNPLYSRINLPPSCGGLLTAQFKNFVHELSDSSTDDSSEDGDSQYSDRYDNIDSKSKLLTQIKEREKYHEQYTIYPLHDKRINDTSKKIYQMQKIIGSCLDNRTKTLDLMCFPHLYPFGRNGQREKRSKRITHFEFIKCKLMSVNSQFRLDQQYLFHLLYDNIIRSAGYGIYHKLHVVNAKVKYTAENYVDLIRSEQLETDLNTIFSKLRNSEQFWIKPRNNLNCMIRHYGPATWFVTFSPADWLWADMANYIREVNPAHMKKLAINELIAADPVSVSRFIDNKSKAVLDFLMSDGHPLGKITHYFWRREYQSRGIQHFHLLLWVEGAPVLDQSAQEDVAAFILRYASCAIPDVTLSPTLYRRVVTHQTHHHNTYCRRFVKRKNFSCAKCRFDFPRAVTKELILKDVALSIAGRRALKSKSRLYDLPREMNERFVNDYNPACLLMWEGNMDIQFVGEVSRTLSFYCTKYINKAEKSASSTILKDVYNVTKPLGHTLWNLTLRSLNNREYGALEAADTLLGMSLCGTDPNTTIRWVDVNMFRNRKVKPYEEILQLEATSTDIFCPNLIDDYYPRRPESLDNINVYDFAKWYDIHTKKPINPRREFFKVDKVFIVKRFTAYLINHYNCNAHTQPERYFFALLYLYKPWRDLDELKNGHDDYIEAFASMKDSLPDAMMYHEKTEEIREGYERMKELIDKCEDDILGEGSAERNCLECEPIEAEGAMKDFDEAINKTPVINVTELIDSLNSDQKRIFDAVDSAIASSDKILRMMVSGEGGTGKSVLIKAIKHHIKDTYGKDVAVTAPTGIAAHNVDGLTIHRLLQLPIEPNGTAKYSELSDAALKVIRDQLKNVVLIIIDEVSMISNVILLYIHLRLEEIFDTTDMADGWFGQRHVLLFGDLLQLRPVRDNPPFVKMTTKQLDNYVRCFGSFDIWKELFSYDELTINMRQKNDESYRSLLSRVRYGMVTDNDIQTLNERVINLKGISATERLDELCNFIDQLPNNAVCLLPTRKMCAEINMHMLEKIQQSEVIQLIARDGVDCVRRMRKKVASLLDKDDEEDVIKNGGLPKVISIKIGAKIMLTRNIDVSLGLVNGTIARVVSVSHSDGRKDDIESVRIALASGEEYDIERVSVKFEIIHRVFVVRKQFPLCLSYAITIHKSQGLTLNTVVIDDGNCVFSYGQIYVALSRVTSLQGLYLINFDPSCILADPDAIVEYNRLRTKYRSSLPLITVEKKILPKVLDRIWVERKEEVTSSASHVIHDDKIFTIRGLPNDDNVSCYANAALQCTLHCSVIKNFYNEQQGPNLFKEVIDEYYNLNKKTNIYNVRLLCGEEYGRRRQQDASEFINQMCNVFDILQQNVTFTITKKLTCTKCSTQNVVRERQNILYLDINNPYASTTLQDMINLRLGCRAIVTAQCESCNNNEKYEDDNITASERVLIVTLKLFTFDTRGAKKIDKFQIKAAPTTVLKLNNMSYKVVSCIFHEGKSVDSGHYTCMIRQNRSWVRVNDSIVTKESWPRMSKNAYVFFLESDRY